MTAATITNVATRPAIARRCATSLRATSLTGAPLRSTATLRAPVRQQGARRSGSVTVQALFNFAKKSDGASSPFYDITVEDIDGRKMNMQKYKGKVVLVTNVASECGFTPQYKGLAELFDKYSKQGLVVIGAPCNQFGSQEPGTNKEIKSFASKQGAKFPLTSKLEVNGPNTSDLYKYLKSQQGGLLNSDVKWNFSKFLVDREGNVVKRYFSTSEPAEIEKDIAALL